MDKITAIRLLAEKIMKAGYNSSGKTLEGSFYIIITIFGWLATSFLSDMKMSMEKMAVSIVELNQKMATQVERNDWHAIEIKKHGDQIRRQWVLIRRIEDQLSRPASRP